MSGGSKKGGGGSRSTQTTTSTTEPPAYLRPYLESGAQRADQLYQQGPMQYYQGNTVVPFASQTETALGRTEQRALNGSPVTGAAQGYATGALSGPITSQFGSATNPYGSGSNPYLDATFNRAADSVQNRIQSSFAGSGRNIEAGRPVAAQELNDLAANIYGGDYQNERNRQFTFDQAERDRMLSDINQQRSHRLGLSSLAPSLANQDYVDINALRGVGSEVEDLTGRLMEDAAARWDFSQNAPGLNLDQYLARIQGMPGSSQSTTTPIYRNTGAGILGGALAGSQIGGSIGSGYPGWGALIGGILGGM